MIVLGIETSCDETSVSIVKGNKVLSNEVSSSVHLHSNYGGVVPEIASRFHLEYISVVFEEALKNANCTIDNIDLIAVTSYPGLPGSLLVGISFAKAISFANNIPLIEVNHVHAHIMSCFLGKKIDKSFKELFPFLGMVFSGGHSSIYYCKNFQDFLVLGQTIDDAVGEAFDKVAKILSLGYPGGPIIERLANDYYQKNKGVKDIIKFPCAMLKDKDNIDFSFSGIKTAVMYYWQQSDKTEKEKHKICFSFQKAAIDVICKKILRALKFTKEKRIAIGGGVINNSFLRQNIISTCKNENIEIFFPDIEYCSDNAAMIALLGRYMFKKEGDIVCQK